MLKRTHDLPAGDSGSAAGAGALAALERAADDLFPLPGLTVTPDRYGLRYEDVSLTAADGPRLNGWFLPAATDPAALTVLFFHGNAGNISGRFDKLAVLRELGGDVFILDYRGYGRSEGQPTEAGTYRDAQAAYDYLTGATADQSAPTWFSTANHSGPPSRWSWQPGCRSRGNPEEPFTSIADVGQRMFPFLPIRLLVRHKYDTLSKIAKHPRSVADLHSRDDEYFSLRHATRLLAAARPPKRLVELRGSHNEAFHVSATAYRAGLAEFMNSIRAGSPDK